ncbi:myosin-binding protein 1-like [Telopea speciosissima]|uniref:myosin-binding protein 1-like n=1 Tax=Telopea speciosissima TaxID=54955 RepID=UPI001CC5C589|nr:myosin-binding protein 1-like [Telopea speciosissima]
MATSGTSSVKVHRCSRGFRTVLASAVLEWLLIFLLFIDAIFSYLVTKFARCWELQIPCLLCSRLDHVLGNEKPGFYRNLICGNHKLEISSLVLCHIHDKLADVHGVCDDCFFSFATENKSNAETYRLLVGKLGMDPERCVDEDPLLNNLTHDSFRTRSCSCCNNPCTMRLSAGRFLPTRLIAPEVGEPDVPSLGPTANNHFQSLGGMQNRREMPSGQVRASHQESRGRDPLSHIGYTELKITSDTESEVSFSDDDDASALACEPDDLKEDLISQCVQLETHPASPEILPKNASGDLTIEKMIHEASTSDPSVLISSMQLEVDKPHDVTSSAPDVAIGHGLEELNWHHVDQRVSPSATCDLISLDDVPASTCVTEAPIEVLGDNLDAMGTSDTGHTSTTESGEVCEPGSGSITTTGLDLKTDQVSNDPSPLVPNSLSDAYKLVVLGKGSQASALLAEQLSGKDSARVSEDLKLLLSQVSAVRGLELSVNDTSPKMHENGDELKISDSSSSIGVQILQKKISLERNESGFESLDGSIVSEIEGESVVDRLKRQVEYDRKSMGALYKELEEERNAAAVAASQALAMITRLQEEKAALHTEALQYLRMMEEQAEYDVEALQKANDLLDEREKDIQDLEAELEFYRAKFPDESVLDEVRESTCDLRGVDRRAECLDLSGSDANANTPYYSLRTRESESRNKPEVIIDMNISKSSVLDFEDERLYISQCLKKLEKRLHLFSNNGVCVELSNGRYSDTHGKNDLDGIHQNESAQGTSQTADNDFSVQNGMLLTEGNPPAEERHNTLDGNPLCVDKENHHIDCDRQDSTMAGGMYVLDAIGNEVSDLNERLGALEAERNFLEHAINSLRNGDEGLKFIREIAHQLRELRKISMRRREKAIA